MESPPLDPPEDFDPPGDGAAGDPLELPEGLEPLEEDSLEAESLLAADL